VQLTWPGGQQEGMSRGSTTSSNDGSMKNAAVGNRDHQHAGDWPQTLQCAANTDGIARDPIQGFNSQQGAEAHLSSTAPCRTWS